MVQWGGDVVRDAVGKDCGPCVQVIDTVRLYRSVEDLKGLFECRNVAPTALDVELVIEDEAGAVWNFLIWRTGDFSKNFDP